LGEWDIREFVSLVLEIDEDIENTRKYAKHCAAELRREGEKRAKELREEILKTAREEAEELKREMLAEAERKADEIIRTALAEAEKITQIASTRRKQGVEVIRKIVLGV